MSTFEEELNTAIDRCRDGIRTIARKIVDEGGLQTQTSDEELDQLVRATEQILREGLAGGDETRRFVLETAVPAYAAAGEQSWTIAGTSVRFAVLLTALLADQVSEENREAAREWLARFYGDYTRETIETMERAR